MKRPIPPRLHVLLARDGTSAVVIRRGPSRFACTYGWDRRDDSFAAGQWLRGRVYERRSDLSPDGRHLIYFAMNGRWGSQTRGSFTAVSRAPYLKALALWPKGDAWQGGGLFTGERSYWLNGCHDPGLHETKDVRPDVRWRPPAGIGNNECLGVYFPRLLRDGWRLVSSDSAAGDDHTVFDKELPRGWRLRKRAIASLCHPEGRGVYYDEHALIDPSGATLDRPGWEWADRDGDRLVWAEAGNLHAAKLGDAGPADVTLLRDFTGDVPARLRAPY